VGCAETGLPSADDDAALIVAKSDSTPDDGPAANFAGGLRRRRRCVDTGNGWWSCLAVIVGGETRSTAGLAIANFLPRRSGTANEAGKLPFNTPSTKTSQSTQ
jgi:hypothetical protein